MKTIFALFVVALFASLTGCATTPSAPLTAGQYCAGQARIATARANMQDTGAMGGHPSADMEQSIYKDCIAKVKATK